MLALCASTKSRTPAPSKKAMPNPSLCSSARRAKPVKLNTRSVGVLAFMPRSWHIASSPREELDHAPQAHELTRVHGFIEHAAHAAGDAGASPRAPHHQVGEPGMGVDDVGP